MSSGSRSVPLVLFLAVACADIIGLSPYKKGEEEGGGGDAAGAVGGDSPAAGQNGGVPSGGDMMGGTGGSAAGNSGTTAADGGAGAAGVGGGGGAAGAGHGGEPDGGTGDGSARAAGSNDAGVGWGGGGAGGDAGSSGKGGGGPCTEREHELLVDGQFDMNADAWESQATDGDAVIEAHESARSGPNVARLGRENGIGEAKYERRLSQLVTIPASAVELVARCFYRITTEDSISERYDVAFFSLKDQDRSTITLIGDYDNKDASNTWRAEEATFERAELDELGLPGATVYFDLYSANDTSLPTDFLFDDCSLRVKTCE